ncbi:MAG TPA: helix-turn-helix domain-containing protein [Gemmatimonadaceae bacterium]|nr:helix-turn-helix domain-containing protein [Gemmatimonadaceae bacterium]
MRWWERHFGDSTRGRIVAILRRGWRSVDEIAATLGLTDNAVRAHIATLERDGVVAAAGSRRDGTVGKPATLYGVAEGADTLFSSAYAPALSALIAELESRHPGEVRSILRGAGSRLGPRASGTFAERVDDAASLLTELGADADVVETPEGYEIHGNGCALSQAVSSHPDACCMVEQLLAEVTGGKVCERCERGQKPPRCSFLISEQPAS